MTDDSDAEAGTVAVECGFGVAAQRGGACGSPSARARRIGGGVGMRTGGTDWNGLAGWGRRWRNVGSSRLVPKLYRCCFGISHWLWASWPWGANGSSLFTTSRDRDLGHSLGHILLFLFFFLFLEAGSISSCF
jgi:hypothetical protein